MKINKHCPSTVTQGPQSLSFFSYFAPNCFKRVSTRNGIESVKLTAASSASLNDVARRPSNIDFPFSSLTLTEIIQ